MLRASFVMSMLVVATGHIALGVRAEIWDDALFFRRVAYNILHHGFAGWNQQEGPVFLNTSQLYQLVSTALLSLAPNHFNMATALWSAACVSAMFFLFHDLLRRESRADDSAGTALLFVLMHAPPIVLAIITGMDTCTVFLVVALFLRVALSDRFGRQPLALAAMNVLTYLARPDAVLLSFCVSIGLLTAPGDARSRRLVKFFLFTGAGILILSAGFHAYYGTALPLATFLKISPLSVYDSDYIALGYGNKLTNLATIALVLLPLSAMIAMRFDRVNASLVIAGIVFIAFHGATTAEIMGYHARFYAPALPSFLLAAQRGVACADSLRRKLLLIAMGTSSAALALVAFHLDGIESVRRGFALERVPLDRYLVYFVGIPIIGLLLLTRDRIRAITSSLLAMLAVACVAFRTIPNEMSVAPDMRIYENVGAHGRSLVGIDLIRRCFQEPMQLVHSELGIPGVLFPESRIIDYTGLANPSVVDREFDFERTCANDRPEFIFRPHWTHKRLNEQLSASPCLSSNYRAAPLVRPSSAPLFVRNDLVDPFNTCPRATER